jgi:hypothetical protein
MRIPWFFATTPIPRPSVPVREPPGVLSRWASRILRSYLAWAERSHEQLRGRGGH